MNDNEDLLARTRNLINGIGKKKDNGLTPDAIEAVLKEEARKYTEECINNPTPEHYLIVHNAFLKGWEIGVRQAIAHMRERGITFSD